MHLALSRRDFQELLSIPARHQAHSGALEAIGVELGCRLLSRRARLHGCRGLFLVDAQAVQAALQKGRSSAPTLQRAVRRVGALSLACGWRWRFGYVPSEDNPADDLSRGRRRHPSVRRTFLKEKRIHQAALRRGRFWEQIRSSPYRDELREAVLRRSSATSRVGRRAFYPL